jgi:hypothetical protein
VGECFVLEGGTAFVDAAPDATLWDGGLPDPATCFSDAALPSLKACAADVDCTFFSHVTNCCGWVEQVGVSVGHLANALACERASASTLPVCNCFSTSVTTEDGKSDVDGATPQVHCTALDGGSFCETSLP